MRKLMWFTLGFGYCCALFAYLMPREWIVWIVLASGVCALLSGILARKWKWPRILALVCMGCMLGALWFGQYYWNYLNGAVTADGETLAVQLHVTDFSYDTDYGSAADCSVTLDGKSYQAKAYLKDKWELAPGQEISGSFRFRVTTPDGEKAATYHQGRGTFLLLYETGEIQVSPGRQTWKDRIAVLRRDIGAILESAIPEDALPFAKALLLGDTRELSYEVDTDLKVSGIRHVAAVSGLHVSILFALLTTVTVKKRFFTCLLGYPCLFLFAALAGFTPSVTRACLMLSLTLLGLLLDKDYDGPTALSFAVLVMLALNPLTITDVGFQLSVGSVAGIFAFSGPISNWIKGLFGEQRAWRGRLLRWFSGSVATTLSAMVITTPLCAAYFGMVSLVSVVTNLLTLWVISFLFYGLLGVCFLGLFWGTGAGWLGWLMAWPIRYVLGTAGILADFPLAAVYTKSGFIGCWLGFFYLLLLGFWISSKKKPAVLGCISVLSLCIALLLSWCLPMLDQVRFAVLDVGQGQSLLFQSEGRAILVDCGGDSDAQAADMAAAALLSQGITKLDACIVTHGDRDHAGGIPGLLSRVETDLLILPQDGAHLHEASKGQAIYPDRDMTLSFGNMKISIFVPRFAGNGNENSLCVLFDTEKCDILITGDRSGFGERSLLRNSRIPDVDVLMAGHHGSKHSTCQELLDGVTPEVVCISVAAGNAYGHPSAEVLERLDKAGCAVYRTDLNGEILIRR